MPDVQDAIKVVTDPANVIGSSDTHSDMRQVNGDRAVRALRKQGAGRAEARDLVSEAVEELGGKVDSEMRVVGRAGGPDATQASPLWHIPAAKVRNTWTEEDGA